MNTGNLITNEILIWGKKKLHGRASSCEFNIGRKLGTDKNIIYLLSLTHYNKLKLILLKYSVYLFLEVSFKLKQMDNSGGALLVF